MNIKLIVADMDGTFLNSDSQFNSESFQLLKENCEEHQIRFVFCTGKQCERVESIIGELSKDTFLLEIVQRGLNIMGTLFIMLKLKIKKGKKLYKQYKILTKHKPY